MKEKKILIEETLVEARSYIKKLIAGIETFIEHLAKNQHNEATALLPQIIDGIDWEFKVLYYLAQSLENDYELARCKDLFSDLSNAISGNDTVAVKDIFEYEILPLLKKWSDYLEEEVALIKSK